MKWATASVVASWCLVAVPASGQLVRNPTAVLFTCPDHARDTDHEIDIVRESDGAVMQTILGGDPPEVNGEVVVVMNVQPIAYGAYRVVVRAVAGVFTSDNSDPSPLWERTPAQPTTVRAQ